MTPQEQELLDLRERCAMICENEAIKIDVRLPNAFGGSFAKKFAANGLRGAAALIRKQQIPLTR